MLHTIHSDEDQIQRTYLQLTFLGMLLHLVQTIIFFLLSFKIPAFYNFFSVIFYGVMLYMTRLKMYRVTVCSIHIECCLFSLFCVISCGWGTGVALYLMAISSLVYFCPFNNKLVPYLFSLTDLAVFVGLRAYTYYFDPIYPPLPESAEMALSIFNSIACFYLVLFAAFSSNISAVVTNIRLRSENKNLSALANSDLLTTLPSRHAFLQRVNALPMDTKLIATIGDLDDFKKINDTFGHAFGDIVLQTVGHLMQSTCGEHALLCRWGGEEFILLFYDCSLNEAVSLLQSLRCQIAAYPFQYKKQQVKVTITFGTYEGTTKDGIDHLINEADKYLYKGKKNGKNCVFTPF